MYSEYISVYIILFFLNLFKEAFIGFGGNQVRKTVKEGAKWFVYSFQELIDELNRKSARIEAS